MRPERRGFAESGWAWARLVRLPNVLTVWADSTAAFAVVVGMSGVVVPRWWGNDPGLLTAWLLVVASITALYWGGMVLNDVFDVRVDRRSRSNRPLPQRQIGLATARRAGWASLGVGLAFASVLGAIGGTPVPIALAFLLSICVVAYDGPLKRSAVAGVLMGGCRFLSFLLAGSAAWGALRVGAVESLATDAWLVATGLATGMGVYIFGITTFARREELGDRTFRLPLGWAAMALGLAILASAPRLAGESEWRLDAVIVYPMAIGLMGLPTLVRGLTAINGPSTKTVQQTIVTALSTIIPLSAAITMLAVGVGPAMGVFALVIPSRYLKRRIDST